jgi:glucokinase
MARQFISINEAKSPFFVGMDLGGTMTKIGVVDDIGRPLSWHSVPTAPESGPEDAAQRLGKAVHEAIHQAGLKPLDIARVGLGSAGILDPEAGVLLKPVNLKGWEDFPIRDRVSVHCGLPVLLANDANAAAYGEFWIGSGREFRSMVLLTLGTGIGCGIILGDFAIDGEHGHGAECGHIVIDYNDNARMCGCGQRGHLEAYASATATVQRTKEALAAGRESSLSGFLELTTRSIAIEAMAGDALSLEIIQDTAKYVAIGVVSLMNTIDPGCILIGGAMTFGGHETELGLRFLGWIKEEVQRRAFHILAEKIAIDFASLGPDAGYLGAAGLARVAFHKEAHQRR